MMMMMMMTTSCYTAQHQPQQDGVSSVFHPCEEGQAGSTCGGETLQGAHNQKLLL